MQAGKLISQVTTLFLSPFRMSSIHSMGMVVHLRWKLALMAHSKHELKSARPGTSRLCCQLGLNGALHYQFDNKYGGKNWKLSYCSCSCSGPDSGLSLPFWFFLLWVSSPPLGFHFCPSFPNASRKGKAQAGANLLQLCCSALVVLAPLLNQFCPPSLMFTLLVLP
jgi:hypothetical protein